MSRIYTITGNKIRGAYSFEPDKERAYWGRYTERLPHRYPFLLLDRVTVFLRKGTAVNPGTKATGIKNVTFNEPFFRGTFPESPLCREF